MKTLLYSIIAALTIFLLLAFQRDVERTSKATNINSVTLDSAQLAAVRAGNTITLNVQSQAVETSDHGFTKYIISLIGGLVVGLITKLLHHWLPSWFPKHFN